MELLVILAVLIAFDLLALRYGYDSRDRLRSDEEQQAAHGLTWPESAAKGGATRR